MPCPILAAGKPSWTAKLAGNPELLCSKILEEAGELCQTLEQGEGKQRAASEMADLLYHSMVLLGVQVWQCVTGSTVCAVLTCCTIHEFAWTVYAKTSWLAAAPLIPPGAKLCGSWCFIWGTDQVWEFR